MSVTATELKMNLGKYLLLAETEDIYITKLITKYLIIITKSKLIV